MNSHEVNDRKEPVPDPQPPLNYAIPPPPRQANPRYVFLRLLPAAICIAAFITSMQIESAFPNGDSRNFGGVCVIILTAPLALVWGAFAVREAFRPRGVRALLLGSAWNAVLVLASFLSIWTIIKFRLLR